MITPEQLRNAARYGQPLRPDTLEWLASVLERQSHITQQTIAKGLQPPGKTTELPIDKQIAVFIAARGYFLKEDYDAILANLEELKRIKAAKVPKLYYYTIGGAVCLGQSDAIPHYVLKSDYDTLLDLLQQETARADNWEKLGMLYNIQKNVADVMWNRVKAAESKLAAVMRLGQEPSGEMIVIGEREGNEQASHGAHCFDVFKAMFAKLLEQAGVGK